jgi:hypothetical protein
MSSFPTTASYEFSIKAAGTAGALLTPQGEMEVWPKMYVKIDSVYANMFDVNEKVFRDYKFSYYTTAGTHNISIGFYDPRTMPNLALYIDSLKVEK